MQSQSARTQNPTMTAKRYLTQEMAQIEIYSRSGKIYCKMGNLSTSGAYFEIISSNYMPRFGDLARITVHLRAIRKTHVIDAEIVWCRGLGIGIQFLKQDELKVKLSEKTAAQAANS